MRNSCRRNHGVSVTKRTYWMSASTATATNSTVRYVIDQWNRRIGRSGWPRRARRCSRCASTRNSAPRTSAVRPYSGVMPSGHRATEATTVSQV